MGASLSSLGVTSAFSRRGGFDMGTCHIFLQGVLEGITLVMGEAGDRTGAGCEVILALHSVTIIA